MSIIPDAKNILFGIYKIHNKNNHLHDNGVIIYPIIYILHQPYIFFQKMERVKPPEK